MIIVNREKGSQLLTAVRGPETITAPSSSWVPLDKERYEPQKVSNFIYSHLLTFQIILLDREKVGVLGIKNLK